MHIGPELAAWLSDRQRQAASQALAAEATARWGAHPLFADLRAELDASGRRNANCVLAAAGRFMDRTAEIEALLGDLVRRARSDPFFVPPLTPVVTEINSGYLLFADPAVTIGLGVISADALAAKRLSPSGTTAIAFTGMMTRYRFLKSGGATLSFWEANGAGADFTGDFARSCHFTGRRRIADGETILLDGRHQSLVVEHLDADMLCLQATVQVDAAPLAVDYASDTLRYIAATSTDEASSRTQMMVTLLRLMDRADALPVIAQALDSPHFYTRWHVMREMLALDAEAALPSLRHMAEDDPHPEVRFAATQALSLFVEDETEEAIQCRA